MYRSNNIKVAINDKTKSYQADYADSFFLTTHISYKRLCFYFPAIIRCKMLFAALDKHVIYDIIISI